MSANGTWEKALGLDHPEVATCLNNLAALYKTQGRYAEAEPLHRRSLAIDEKVFGPEHPSVATDLNNLAALYDDQSRYSEAGHSTSSPWRSGRRRSAAHGEMASGA